MAHALNVQRNWDVHRVAYQCTWCEGWHLTRAKPGTHRWKMVEKARRKAMWVKGFDGKPGGDRSGLDARRADRGESPHRVLEAPGEHEHRTQDSLLDVSELPSEGGVPDVGRG